ncbi:(S)-beta-bisabolene synthase, partial [Biomphalaria glabrata]
KYVNDGAEDCPYSENRKAAYVSEIKSAHLGKNQKSVHPVVIKWSDTASFFLSDDICHDHHAVKTITLKALELVKEKAPSPKSSNGVMGQPVST